MGLCVGVVLVIVGLWSCCGGSVRGIHLCVAGGDRRLLSGADRLCLLMVGSPVCDVILDQ